jgi:multidrug efflux pump
MAVFSGMLGVTLFGIFLTPVFFFIINRTSETGLFSTKLVRVTSLVLLLPLRVPMMLFRALRPN